MKLVVRPFTKAETAEMPKFNNVEAIKPTQGLSDSFIDKVGNLGKKVYSEAERIYNVIDEAKRKTDET